MIIATHSENPGTAVPAGYTRYQIGSRWVDSNDGSLALATAELARLDANSTAAAMNAFKDQFREKREKMLNRIASIAALAKDDGDTVVWEAYKTARLTLLDMTKHETVLAATNVTALEAAFAARYAAMVADMPMALKLAFGKVDM